MVDYLHPGKSTSLTYTQLFMSQEKEALTEQTETLDLKLGYYTQKNHLICIASFGINWTPYVPLSRIIGDDEKRISCITFTQNNKISLYPLLFRPSL